MKTTIVGFQRIGKERELKSILETYFKGETDEKKVLEVTKNLQQKHYSIMEKYIDILPCNDFSLYDSMLDTMWMLGIVPVEYIDNELSELEKYFAIARGYQSEKINLKAFEMKKWFDTNYHYIVPKLTDNLYLKINTNFLEDRIKIAKSLNIKFKVNLIGPFTFLMLSKPKIKTIYDFKEVILSNYLKILEFLRKENIEHLQIEEPALVFDLEKKEKKFFKEIYSEVLKYRGEIKVILQTYFGDVRDIYDDLMQLDFEGIGLDFVSGKENLRLLEKSRFDREKIIVAGIIDGRNIWKSDYRGVVDVIERILKYTSQDNMWLSSSCSLLHIPYTVEVERKIPQQIKEMLSFAVEKLSELKEIKDYFSGDSPPKTEFFVKNKNSIENFKRFVSEESTKVEIDSIDKSFFNRKIHCRKRSILQRKTLNLPLLPATTIGSFPQTSELRKKRKDYREGRITKEEYEDFIKGMIKEVIKIQEEIGLDVLVHGEFERNDMVEYFAEFLTGVLTTENGWVQSYGVRVTKPPIIYGNIRRKESMTLKWITYAQSLTEKPMKAILTGPITIINWSFVRKDISLKDVAYQIAFALREEIDELQKAGIKIIQVDEAALREKLPLRRSEWKEYLDVAINAFKLATSVIKPEVQLHTHMCYSEFSDIINYIEKMDVDVITIEAAKSELSILNSLKKYVRKRQIGPGVYDIHSPRIPEVEEIEDLIKKILTVVPTENLWINPDCGLKTRKFEEAIPSLKNMVKAKEKIISTLKKV